MINFKKILVFVQSLMLTISLSTISGRADSETENSTQNLEEEHTPKVTVVVPVYKAENYIAQCLDSLINQTIKKEDLEIICVNDGSPDNSLEILEEYAKRDDRIKVIDKENGGVSSARNTGIEQATGEYIAFIDSDDYIDKNTFEDVSHIADEKNADITCYGWRNFTDDGSTTSRKNCLIDEEIFTNWKTAKRERASVVCWNKLYRRSLIIDNGVRFNSEIKIAEDECFNLCLYPFANTIVHIPYVLYNYRVNMSSATKTMSFMSMISNYLKVWQHVNAFYREHKINFSILDKIRYFVIYKDDFWAIVLPTLGF